MSFMSSLSLLYHFHTTGGLKKETTPYNIYYSCLSNKYVSSPYHRSPNLFSSSFSPLKLFSQINKSIPPFFLIFSVVFFHTRHLGYFIWGWLWCVVCSVWCVVCGVWCVVCGVVCGVACGVWRVYNICVYVSVRVCAWYGMYECRCL